jgi:O-antigen/teichoic acid export membrane protein
MRRLGSLTWKAFPLGMVMMFFWLHMNIPRYYLESYRGETELGVFTALAYLTVAGNVVMQALGQAVSSRLARHHAAGGVGAFRKLLFRLLGIGFIGGVVGLLLVAVAGAPLLRLLYGPEYAEHLGLLGLLMTAAAISYLNSFLGDALTAARVFRTQVPLCILVTLVTLAACWLWVPRYGMQGAAGALIAAGVVRFLASGLVIGFAGRTQSTEVV